MHLNKLKKDNFFTFPKLLKWEAPSGGMGRLTKNPSWKSSFFSSRPKIDSIFVRKPGVIKLFTMVIYCQSIVITTVIFLFNTEWQQYHGMVVKSNGNFFKTLALAPEVNFIKTFSCKSNIWWSCNLFLL